MLAQGVSNETAKRALARGVTCNSTLKERIPIRRQPSWRPDNIEASSQFDVAQHVFRASLEFLYNANSTHPEGRLPPVSIRLNVLRWIDAG
jgi:hypothetical protein